MDSINDKLFDAIVYHSAVDLLQIEAGQRAQVLKMMTALEKDLLKEMMAADITGVQRNTFQKQRLAALLKQSQETINTHVNDYAETHYSNLYDLAEEEGVFTETMFNNAYQTHVASVALSPSRLKAIAKNTLVEGDIPKQWWGAQSKSLQQAFARQMRMGMLRSETIGELAKRIRDNVTPTSRRNALALVRTSSMAVVQEARRDSYKQVDDLLKGYKFCATLDSRTTKYCASCDNAIFNLDYKVRKGPKFCNPPPNHWQCFIDRQIPIYTETGWKKIGDIQVGDKVLTHKGRFKKVTELLFRKKQSPIIYTLRFSNLRKSKKITVTEGHPIEVERNNEKVWVPVEEIRIGDRISFLSNRCACGKMIPFYLKWCSLSCKAKLTGGNWAKDPVKRKVASERSRAQMYREYANGVRDPYTITKKANERIREMVRNGEEIIPFEVRSKATIKAHKNCPQIALAASKHMKEDNPSCIPEIREKMTVSFIKTLRENPDSSPNRVIVEKGKWASSLEKQFAEVLDEMDMVYDRQTSIDKYFVDFSIPDLNIVLEVDGHTKYGKYHKVRDRVLGENGWDVFHIAGKELKSPQRLKRRLSRILNNHEGNYEFMPVIVSDIKKWTGQRPRTLYNFSVEEDESYIAQGFVVHNCRSTLSPLTKSWSELEQQYHGTSKMKDLEKIPTKMRASMDGQVPADKSYTQWLKGKGDKFQNKVLGPVRAKLFRDGKITNMSNLLDQSGNPLTIPELKSAIQKSALIQPIDRKLAAPDLSVRGKKILADKESAQRLADEKIQAKRLEEEQIIKDKDAEIKDLKSRLDVNASPTEIKSIKDSRGNGVALRTDKDQIEDAEILFFPETGVKGQDLTSAMFKVRKDTINTEGWERKSLPFESKTIKKGGLTRTNKLTESEFYEFYEKDFDGVTVRYYGSSDDTHLAFRGRVEMTVNGSPDTGVDDIYKVLGKMGIDNKRITPEYEEEMYLLQLLYGFNKPAKLKEVHSMLEYVTEPADRVIFLKKSYNTWVGRKVTDSPEYNPSGTYQAFQQGHKLNMRPDLASDPDWKEFSEDFMIHHKFYGKGIDTLKNIVNSGGNLISTTDKLRRGVSYSGMSPTADIRSGGASYTFTRIWRKGKGADVEGIVWKTNVLKRTDAISYPTDYYGSVVEDVIEKGMHHKGGRVRSVKAFQEISGTHVDNETLFKNALSIFDEVDHIKINAADYDDAVSFMKKEIGDHFPDGRKVEDVLFEIKDEDMSLAFDSDGNIELSF